MKSRNSNFELLRILAIFFIILMHTAGMTAGSERCFTNVAFGTAIGCIGNMGVTIFVLISGYFGIKFRAERFVQLCILTTFYSVFVCLINTDWQLTDDVFKSFLVIPLYNNWFISCYLITMLLSPFINDFAEKLEKHRFIGLITVLFLTFNLLPTFFNTPYYTVLYVGG